MTSSISVSSLSTCTRAPNSFYECYIEMCKRKNRHPLSIVKPARIRNKFVLDFVVDRVSKAEEWYPIIKALSMDTTLQVISLHSKIKGVEFLHNVSTEADLRQTQRKNGLLWTDYVFKSLMKSLSLCLKQNSSLATLELDGMPLYPEYFELLLKSISNNNSLRNLTLKHCLIGDSGCISLCKILRNKLNIETLNLSFCELSPSSAKEIAKLINTHQNSRLIECWHNSLRYRDPELSESGAKGLKRITLNNNSGIGDEGLSYIIDEFIDEAWIKALDMQRCGITENISEKLLSVLDQNTSLEIADFRFNDGLLPGTLDRIFTILIQREPHSGPTYQWCESVSSKTTLASTNPLRSRSQTTSRPKPRSSRMPIKSSESNKELAILNDRLKEGLGKNKRLKSKNDELKEKNKELENKWRKLQNMHPDLVGPVNKAIFDIHFRSRQTNFVSQNTRNSKPQSLVKDRSISDRSSRRTRRTESDEGKEESEIVEYEISDYGNSKPQSSVKDRRVSDRSSIQTVTDMMSEIGFNLPLEEISNSSNKSTERTVENSNSPTRRTESDEGEEESEIVEYEISDYDNLTSDDESNAEEDGLNSPSSNNCDFESLMKTVEM